MKSYLIIPLIAVVMLIPGLAQNVRTESDQTPEKRIDFGIYQIAWNPWQFNEELDNVIAILDKKPSFVTFFRDIHKGRGFPFSYVEIIDKQDAVPIISWELWIWGEDPNRDYLQSIIDKEFDSYFLDWAKDCKDWNKPLLIRPGFEMNGNWFPWCGDPVKFKQAWKHMFNLFKSVDCNNVSWVWSANIKSFPDKEWNHIRNYYPGDEFVHWIGLDGYNWGDKSRIRPYSTWQSFIDIFDKPLKEVNSFASDKPIMISEVSCSESSYNKKARWIDDFFFNLIDYPFLKSFIWFNYDKRSEGEPDWRVNSSDEALKSFNNGINELNKKNYEYK